MQAPLAFKARCFVGLLSGAGLKVGVPDMGFQTLFYSGRSSGLLLADCGSLLGSGVYNEIVSQPLLPDSVWGFLLCLPDV